MSQTLLAVFGVQGSFDRALRQAAEDGSDLVLVDLDDLYRSGFDSARSEPT